MLQNHLRKFGLTDNEVEVYLALIKLKRASAHEISKKTSISRTTIYGLLEELIAKGLISREISPKVTYFSPLHPKTFARIVQQEEELLAEKKQSAQLLMDELTEAFSHSEQSGPRLEYFEGKKSVELALYQNLPRWRESYRHVKDATLLGYQDHSFVEEYPKWHEFAWNTRDEGEKIRLFSNAKGVAHQNRSKVRDREVRALPTNLEFPCSIWVRGTYVILASTRHTPHYLIVIHDNDLSQVMRIVFRILWTKIC